jgi:hypothetical protein
MLAALAALWPALLRAGRTPALPDVIVWLVGLGAIAGLLGAVDLLAWRPRPAFVARRWLLNASLVALPMALAALLTFPTLADPYFSAIGDEYAFWEFARDLARGAPRDPFSQAGVYGNHPVLSSYLMAGTMRLFGPDQVGWRAASALSLVLAAGALTVLGMLALNRAAGVVAGVGLAAAHPLLAYAHTGYNNIQASGSADDPRARLWVGGPSAGQPCLGLPWRGLGWLGLVHLLHLARRDRGVAGTAAAPAGAWPPLASACRRNRRVGAGGCAAGGR